jgi:hypothetical protein
MTGSAQYEIRIDGTPRSYRDRKDYADGGRAAHQGNQRQRHAQACG